MEIIIKGKPKEIADLVLAVQSRQEDSLENYEALKKRLSRDFSEEIELINALADFVIRVAKGKATSETEVEVLPEVARVVADYYLHSINRC